MTLYVLWALGTKPAFTKWWRAPTKVTLVVAFTPFWWQLVLVARHDPGAYLAIGLGLATWLPLEYLAAESGMPLQFAWFLMNVAGIVAGSLISQKR